MLKSCYQNACLLVVAQALVGCGATQFVAKMPDSLAVKPGELIELLPIENATGKTLEVPADKIFNEYMAKLLQERNLLAASAQPSSLVFKAKLVEYEPGNAFGRWLLPGVGTTVCTVHAELLDKKTGALAGRMEARQTVSFGGAYSIGADEYICKRAADDLIAEIDKRLGKKEPPQ